MHGCSFYTFGKENQVLEKFTEAVEHCEQEQITPSPTATPTPFGILPRQFGD